MLPVQLVMDSGSDPSKSNWFNQLFEILNFHEGVKALVIFKIKELEMQIYLVISAHISFGIGEILMMGEEQYELRKRMLAKVKGEKNTYSVTQGTVYFKNGEHFGLKGDMPKGYYNQVVMIVDGEEKPMLPNPAGSVPVAKEELSVEESGDDSIYEAMERDELWEEAGKRGLNPHNNLGKPKLIALLEESDIENGTLGDDLPPDYGIMTRDEIFAEALKMGLDPAEDMEKEDLLTLIELSEDEDKE